MLCSYFSRLECLIERWQSRRKTLDISPSSSKMLKSTKVKETLASNQSNLKQSTATLNFDDEGKDNHPLKSTSTANSILTTCPSLLYASSTVQQVLLVVCLLLCHLQYNALLFVAATAVTTDSHHQPPPKDTSLAQSLKSTRNNLIKSSSSSPISSLVSRPTWSPDFSRSLISGLSHQRHHHQPGIGNLGERWIHIPSAIPTAYNRDHTHHRPARPVRRERLLTRLSNRIGSRNTIRVHNAFRDLAWRLLSSLSMPTPVIYELRRQNFYSPEDDVKNDSLFNKNTSKTIRSRNLPIGRVDNDDDETEILRERIRSRLEDLISRSRRSLVGRMIRMPALFPFKRQQDEGESGSNNLNKTNVSKSKGPRGFFAKRKKKKESDRQMISIDGKQYYVDDDGALKELKEDDL